MVLLIIVSVAILVIAATAAGVLYVSQDSRRASIHLDKQRLREVRGEVNHTVEKAVRSTEEAAQCAHDRLVRTEPEVRTCAPRERSAV
jgi:hypothetical protein